MDGHGAAVRLQQGHTGGGEGCVCAWMRDGSTLVCMGRCLASERAVSGQTASLCPPSPPPPAPVPPQPSQTSRRGHQQGHAAAAAAARPAAAAYLLGQLPAVPDQRQAGQQEGHQAHSVQHRHGHDGARLVEGLGGGGQGRVVEDGLGDVLLALVACGWGVGVGLRARVMCCSRGAPTGTCFCFYRRGRAGGRGVPGRPQVGLRWVPDGP